MTVGEQLFSKRFPRSSNYHPEWIIASASGGANALWLTEWLAEAIDLPRTCGSVPRTTCSAFGMPTSTMACFRSTRMRGPCRSPRSFDAVVCIDSFVCYGTDDLYLNYLARFLKPGGVLGVAGAGLMQEIDVSVPDDLRAWWEPSMVCLHSAGWWRRHWERTGILEIDLTDTDRVYPKRVHEGLLAPQLRVSLSPGVSQWPALQYSRC